jgi:formate dehydrogenase gamma subunit
MAEEARAEAGFIRFSRSQRLQHVLLIMSFTCLALTGLPQRYSDAEWARGLIFLMGGLDAVRLVHHLAGVMLLFQGLYHVIESVWDLLPAGPRSSGMWPRAQDSRDALGQVAYLVGARAEKPRFGRYDFRSKLEYWSVVWGTLIMGVTGLILLFPVVATSYLPGVVVTASRVAHSYEALLAVLAVAVWHFYHAHLAGESFPMDTSIFSGRISAEKMREHHPLEYEQLMLERGQPGAGDE